MVLAVGVDLVSIARVARLYKRYPLLFPRRILGAREKALAAEKPLSAASLAARFAAKEAVLKAIGCGIGPAALVEVDIIALPGKQPRVILSGHAARFAAARGIEQVALSITHEPPLACAVAVAYGRYGQGNLKKVDSGQRSRSGGNNPTVWAKALRGHRKRRGKKNRNKR